jgi:hypothetical protein
MQHLPAAACLDTFRQALYNQALGRRKDTLSDLLDAVLVAPGRESLARLTLSPLFRRRWASAPDALAEGTLDEAACRRLCVARLTPASVGDRPVWALDGTSWPRPAARTSRERTWTYRPLPGIPQEGLVPGWEFQWLVEAPLPGTSWLRPLDVARRSPAAGTPTALGLGQLRRVLPLLPADYPRPVVTCDSGYDPLELAAAIRQPDPTRRLGCDALVRLNPRRVFWTAPPRYSGVGRPRQYGDKVRLWQPATLPAPDAVATTEDARHGTVTVSLWRGMRQRPHADLPITLVRVAVARLPRAGQAPAPLWLAWIGETEPTDLLDLWRWYSLRFTIEQGFRFLKQALGWTTVRVRDPGAAERWTWLLLLGLWQLWLAREVVADQRLPWERALAPERLTPGRVQRAMGPILASVGTPARPVAPRGKSAGRRPGQRPGPAVRHPVQRRHPKPATARQRAA